MFHFIGRSPVMKFRRRRDCSDDNWFGPPGVRCLSTSNGLAQFQIGMDRGTAFQLCFQGQKIRSAKYVAASADP